MALAYVSDDITAKFEVDEAAEIRDLLAGVSIETTPAEADRIDSYAELLAPLTRVFVTFLPNIDYRDVVRAAAKVRADGMVPVPHIPARTLTGRAELDQFVDALAGEAGIDEALVIGGGLARPAGDFHCALQILESGALDRVGVRRIGLAGHPEGSPDIAPGDARQAIADKNAFARRSDAEFYLVTQFVFEAAPVIAWDKALAADGNWLPIVVGLPGCASLKTLIKYAKMCGVGASMRFLTRRASSLAKLATVATPDRLIRDLARYRAEDPGAGVAGVHAFPFGAIRRTTGWLNAAADGRFTLDQKGGFTVEP